MIFLPTVLVYPIPLPFISTATKSLSPL